MLKKVAVSELRPGMHLHAVEGSWLDHPFWRTRFRLQAAGDIARLASAGVRECWIDVGKGLDVAPPAPPATSAVIDVPAPKESPPALRPMAEELHQAAAICRRGRDAVQAMFHEARLGRALDTERCLPLVDEISGSVMRNPGALVSLARLKTQDDYSYMHSVAVCALMVALARQLGHDDEACRRAGLAGLLHDIGKAVMPLEVLNKPGKLTEAEFGVIRTHPERGHALLAEAGGAPADAMDVCLHHHERVDGTGYPHRLAGERLSLLARMGAVCDVYDAITSNRPYKAGWDPAESIAKMASWKGQFDDAVFAAFVKSLGIYPTGSLVRLASGRLAIVVEQNARALTAPVVKVFFSTRAQMHQPPERLDLAQAARDRIVGRESPAAWGFKDLESLWADPGVVQRSRGG
jgi:putative nucleotidyltransferase with HDIG domain